MIKTLFLMGITAALTGCAGLNEAITKYGGTDPVTYKIGDTKWRIFDQPENGRMMITTDLDAAAAAGAKQGITFGLADNPYASATAYEPAATAYLASRRCEIIDGHLVVPMQYEFEYEC